MIKKIHDQHIHTKYSFDATEELENYYKRANELGVTYFVSCDHIDFDLVHTKCNWEVDFEALKNDMKGLSQKYPNITSLLGVELGFRKDKLKEMYSILNSQEFDLVNLSVHDNGVYDYYVEETFIEHGADVVMREYFKNLYDAVMIFNDFDVLSHIDYVFRTLLIFNPQSDFFAYKKEITAVLKRLIAIDKTLEINTKVQEAINNDEHLVTLLKLYKLLGGKKIAISSDAHGVNRYQSNFEKYIKIIKECGFDELRYYIKRKEYIYAI